MNQPLTTDHSDQRAQKDVAPFAPARVPFYKPTASMSS